MHIGEIIENEVQKKGVENSVFAESIGMTPNGLRKIYKKPTIQSDLIATNSKVLEVNIFHIIAGKFQAESGIKYQSGVLGQQSEIKEGQFTITVAVPEEKGEWLMKSIFQ